jgi:hypothetical protein
MVDMRDRLDCVGGSPILGSSHGVLVDTQDRLKCVEGSLCSVAVRSELDHLTVFGSEAENGQDTCRIHRLPTRQPYPYRDRLPGRGPDEYRGWPGVQAHPGGDFHSPHCGHVHFPVSCDSAGGCGGVNHRRLVGSLAGVRTSQRGPNQIEHITDELVGAD